MNTFSCTLAFSLSLFFLSLSRLWTCLCVVRRCSISQHPRATHFIRAIVPLKLPLVSSVSSPLPPCLASSFRYGRRARSLLILPSTPRTQRPHPSRSTRATRVPTYSSALTADRSHILGRKISKLETRRENQPAGRTFVVLDAENTGYLDKTCVTRDFWPLASHAIFSVIIAHIMSICRIHHWNNAK